MGDVGKKMGNQLPEAFLRFYVLLPTYLTVFTRHYRITVQAIFFFSFFKMRHCDWLFVLLKKQRNGLGYIQKNHLAPSCEYPFNFEVK